MKKILLIQPSPYDQNHKPIKKKRLYFVGLAMPLLAAMMPDSWETEIILEILEEIPFDTDADLIGISTMGHGVIRSIDIAKEFRQRGKTVILGGYMASIMAEEATKYCDSVVIGDAELVWKNLLADFEKGELKKIYQEEIQNGTFSTPAPRFDLIVTKNIGDFLPVQAGRGCPNTCSFCSVACLYQGRYIKKPLEEVIRDIRQVKALGFKKFLLLDDNIFSDRKYLYALLAEIEKMGMGWMSQSEIRIGEDDQLLEKLAKSGCTTLSFGLESLSAESLIKMNKGWADPLKYSQLIKNIQKFGIDVSTEMVVGGEGDTLASIRGMKNFIEENRISVPRFYILTPIPGTRFYQDMERAGRIVKDNIYSFDGTQAVHEPVNMTPDQLTQAYWDLYKSLFSIQSIIKRNIMRKEFLKKPGKYLFYCLVNLYYKHQINNRITPNIF